MDKKPEIEQIKERLNDLESFLGEVKELVRGNERSTNYVDEQLAAMKPHELLGHDPK